MTVEIIEAIGKFIIMSVCAFGALAFLFWAASK